MRTRAQILAQCETRMIGLELEAESKRFSCASCLHREGYGRCANPLIAGFDSPPINVDNCGNLSWYPQLELCGAEKALWESAADGRWWARLLIWIGLREPTTRWTDEPVPGYTQLDLRADLARDQHAAQVMLNVQQQALPNGSVYVGYNHSALTNASLAQCGGGATQAHYGGTA
jgi:hypothetical protein